MNIFVGGIPYSSEEHELRALFEAYGDVDSAKIIYDRDTGRSRGFGFVEMSDDKAAQSAIDALNGSEMAGRTITVNMARPREKRDNRGGGGGGGYNRSNW